MNSIISKTRFITLGLAVALLPFSMRFCHLALLIFLISCIAEGNFINRGKLIVQNPLIWILPSLFMIYVFGVFYSDEGGWSVIDKKAAFFFGPLIIATATPFSKLEIKRLMWVFVGACVVGTAICFANAMMLSETAAPFWNLGPAGPYNALHPGASNKWVFFSYLTLSSGINIHPTYFALYLLVCVLIVLRTVNNKWTQTLLIIYLLVFIVLLSSRVVVLATAATLIYVIVTNSRSRLLIAAIVVMISVLFISPIAFYRNTQEYTVSNFTWPPAQMSDNPISIRMSLLWLSLKAMGQTNPIIGTGTGDVKADIAALQDEYNAHNVLNTSDPHNQFIQTYLELGAIGLLTLLAAFITPLVALYRQKEFIICAGLVAFVAVCLTESALESQKGILLFVLAVSLTGNQLREWRFTTQRLKYA